VLLGRGGHGRPPSFQHVTWHRCSVAFALVNLLVKGL
jgi:hypothetical protein